MRKDALNIILDWLCIFAIGFALFYMAAQAGRALGPKEMRSYLDNAAQKINRSVDGMIDGNRKEAL